MSIQNNKKAEKHTRFFCFSFSNLFKAFAKMLFPVVLMFQTVVFGGFSVYIYKYYLSTLSRVPTTFAVVYPHLAFISSAAQSTA